MAEVTNMLEYQLKRGQVPVKPRVFRAHDATRSRVLMKSGHYSDPVEHAKMWQFLNDNLDSISPEVPIAISKAEQARVGR